MEEKGNIEEKRKKLIQGKKKDGKIKGKTKDISKRKRKKKKHNTETVKTN